MPRDFFLNPSPTTDPSLYIKKKKDYIIKTLNKVGIEEIYLNVKAIYNNPIANVTLSDEKLTALLLIRKKTRMPTVATSI